MNRRCSAVDSNIPTLPSCPFAEIDVFKVHKKLIVKTFNVLEHAISDHHTETRNPLRGNQFTPWPSAKVLCKSEG